MKLYLLKMSIAMPTVAYVPVSLPLDLLSRNYKICFQQRSRFQCQLKHTQLCHCRLTVHNVTTTTALCWEQNQDIRETVCVCVCVCLKSSRDPYTVGVKS